MAHEKKTDRRLHSRYAVRILVDYAAADKYLYDYSGDLSETGVFIETTSPLEKGEELDLRFVLPGTEQIFQLRGEVMWVNHRRRETREIRTEAGLAEAVEQASHDDVTQSGKTPTLSETVGKELPEGMGIRFLNLTPAEQKILRDFLRRETT